MPVVDFNRLSPDTRRRLADPTRPLVFFEMPRPLFRWWAAIALGLGLGVAAWNATDAVSWKAMALWGAAVFGLTAGLAGLLGGVLVRKQASPRNGVHVFALDLVVVEGPRLTIYPMHDVACGPRSGGPATGRTPRSTSTCQAGPSRSTADPKTRDSASSPP